MKDKQPSMQPCECSRCTTRWDEKQEQIRAAQREATSQSPEVLASYRGKTPPSREPDSVRDERAGVFYRDANRDASRDAAPGIAEKAFKDGFAAGQSASAASGLLHREMAAVQEQIAAARSSNANRPLVEQGRAALEGLGAAHGRIGCAVAGDRTSYAMASTLSAPMTDSPAFQRLDKTFTRAEVLAVLKSRKAILDDRPHFSAATRELDALVSIFERME